MADVANIDRELPIEWVVSDDLRSVLATNVSIVRTEHETTLSFFGSDTRRRRYRH